MTDLPPQEREWRCVELQGALHESVTAVDASFLVVPKSRAAAAEAKVAELEAENRKLYDAALDERDKREGAENALQALENTLAALAGEDDDSRA